MNKYLTVFRTSFKQEKDAIINTLLRAVSFVLIIYIFLQLWGYIYGEGGSGTIIKGYNMGQMIWYLIITELITMSAKVNTIVRTVSNEIKSGSISYKLNKPYNYLFYCISSSMAKSCMSLIFMLPVAVIMGIVFVGLPSTFVWYQILPCLLALLVSIFISWSLYSIVGLIAFWVQDAFPFYWIVSKVFMLLGLFFPIEFYPAWLQPIIKYSPIYSMMSGPATLVANFSWWGFLEIFLSQLIWGILVILLGLLVYRLGKRKVAANGG